MYVTCCNVYVRTSWVQIAATNALLSDKIIVGANTTSAVQLLSNAYSFKPELLSHSAAFVAQRTSADRGF